MAAVRKELPRLLRHACSGETLCFPCRPTAHTGVALFSTRIAGDTPVLVRDYIKSALYDPDHGYFSKRSGSVGLMPKSIKFNELEGRSDYLKLLDKLYKENDIAWFTPVELFKPWYAHGIAEAILRTADLSVPLKIYEIGGGSGTCAKCIMDYMMLNAPSKVYRNMKYISVEISPALAEKQMETIGEVRSHLSHFQVECRDAADRNGWGVGDPQPCWVIMLEVLDNLPHDLIYSKDQASSWLEVWLEKQADRLSLLEQFKPLQDPLIMRCIDIVNMNKKPSYLGARFNSAAASIFSKMFPKPQKAWMPTGCLMSLIASDFSYLPDVKISGERAPLVSVKRDGHTTDCSSYLDAMGHADIFFPTDFWLLELIDHHCAQGQSLRTGDGPARKIKQRRTVILDSAAFMEEFGLPSKTRTKDGYNPLLDDFQNTKFYLSVPTHNAKRML
ncbi:uncharacterized protein LOC116250809 isoform X2 [Nymphaea colorata]|uniref:uncharacterized protein LOC116250809 isoform X2 n=1 Tax=Nymphaea colorata TaxID=210225 RepID=UPI00214DFFA3|nr:uncharacterized protein LOC116250809 isoform X2 [Nymphaea colorata]